MPSPTPSPTFVTNGMEADIYAVAARTSKDKESNDISIFVIEKGAPGFDFGKKEKKLGYNTNPTCELIFDNCKVPAENLLGSEGEGMKIFLQALEKGRITTGCTSLGFGSVGLRRGCKLCQTTCSI